MESDLRYYLRRLQVEQTAAARAVTPAARNRRLALAEEFSRKVETLRAQPIACA